MKAFWGLVIVGVVGVGCDRGGVLTGSGGAGQVTGLGGHGGSRILLGTGGNVVVGTGAGGFTAPCGGRPAPPVPPDVLIVLDTSASMNDAIDGPCGAAGCGP